jgi:hypothetical protein
MDEFKITGVKEEKIDNYKDTIFSYLDSVDIEGMQEKIYSQLNELMNTQIFDKIIQATESNISHLEDDIEYVFDQTEFTYNLNMPGIILDTNADVLRGNRMRWDIDPTELFLSDKSCHAESRIVNRWAFIVSGIIILFAVFMLIWAALKKRKQ